MNLVTFDDIAFLVLAAAGRAPFGACNDFAARFIAGLDQFLRRGRRRAIRKGLSCLDPQRNDAELDALVNGVYRARWSASGDACYRVWNRGRHVARMIPSVEGLGRLREALDGNRGVILWESPFGSRSRFHLTLLSEGIPFLQVHGAEHGGSMSWLGQRFVRGYRRALEAKVVPRIVDIQDQCYSYLRQIKSHLASNGVVCMPGFGPKGLRFVELDFLGEKVRFATGVASLALATGAALIPVYCFQDRSGAWKTVFEEPVSGDLNENRSNARETILERYAHSVESYVRRYPEQWRRWHVNPAAEGSAKRPAVLVDRPAQRRSEAS